MVLAFVMIDLVLSVSNYHSHDLVDFVVLGQISLQQSGIKFYPLGITVGLYFVSVEYATHDANV